MALYLYAAGLPPAVNAAIVLVVLSALVFVRDRLRLSVADAGAAGADDRCWVSSGAAMLVAIIAAAARRAVDWLLSASLFFPAYYTVLSLVAAARRRAAAAAAPMTFWPTERSATASRPPSSSCWSIVDRGRRHVDDASGLRRLPADARRRRHLVPRRGRPAWFRMDEQRQDVPLARHPGGPAARVHRDRGPSVLQPLGRRSDRARRGRSSATCAIRDRSRAAAR